MCSSPNFRKYVWEVVRKTRNANSAIEFAAKTSCNCDHCCCRLVLERKSGLDPASAYDKALWRQNSNRKTKRAVFFDIGLKDRVEGDVYRTCVQLSMTSRPMTSRSYTDR